MLVESFVRKKRKKKLAYNLDQLCQRVLYNRQNIGSSLYIIIVCKIKFFIKF